MKFLIENETFIANRPIEGYKKSDILTFNFLHEFFDFIKKAYPEAVIKFEEDNEVAMLYCPFEYDCILTIQEFKTNE